MLNIAPLSELFWGTDIFIDVFSVIVLAILAFYAIRYRKLNPSQSKYKYFITSFIILAVSFLFKILTHFTIYSHGLETRNIGLITITYQTVKASSILVFWGFLIYRVLSFFALYLLYAAYTQKQAKKSVLIIIYLLLLAGYMSDSAFYVYHLTSFFLLFMITDSLWQVYIKNKHFNTKLLAISFAAIMASQGLFITLSRSPLFYVAAEIIQLIAYILLLITFIKVLRDAKKARKN